jgi:hypothetical protein
MSKGTDLIAGEREHQITDEGYTPRLRLLACQRTRWERR